MKSMFSEPNIFSLLVDSIGLGTTDKEEKVNI